MKMVRFVKPMLCTLIKEPFDDKEWLFETKWDGYRAIAVIHRKKAQLYSRNHKSLNKNYPKIVSGLERLSVDSIILDGEIVAFDPSGKQDFQLLQNYQRSQKGRVVYYVFDILYLNGQDLRKLPLIERKSFLKRLHLNSSTAPIESTPFILKKGTAFFKKAEKKGLEGIIGKNTQTPYKMQRSPDWVKIKTHKRQEVVIGGYTQGKGSREKFGALLIGVYKGKALKYIGKVGTGFSRETLSYLSKLLKPLKQEKCPFMPEIPTSSATWVKPSLICEVSFSEWTRDGKLRHPTFKGMRVDKKAKQVKKERAKNG